VVEALRGIKQSQASVCVSKPRCDEKKKKKTGKTEGKERKKTKKKQKKTKQASFDLPSLWIKMGRLTLCLGAVLLAAASAVHAAPCACRSTFLDPIDKERCLLCPGECF
jgi:hypothetical protein